MEAATLDNEALEFELIGAGAGVSATTFCGSVSVLISTGLGVVAGASLFDMIFAKYSLRLQ